MGDARSNSRVCESIEAYVNRVAVDQSPVAKGNAFSEWVLINTLELRDDEIDDATSMSGKNDNGLDAMFEDDDFYYALQMKYSNSHSLNAMLRFRDDCSRLLLDSPLNAGHELAASCARLRERHARRSRLKFIYITNAEFDQLEIIRAKEAIKQFQEQHGIHVSLDFWDVNKISDVIDESIGRLPRELRGNARKLIIGSHFETDDAIVTSVRLKDLAIFVKQAGNGLFHSNIRNYLNKTPINRGMRDTLTREPDKFWFFNNGVTIVCADYSLIGGVLQLKEPQIVNGCQTARTVMDYYIERAPGELTHSELNALLLVRIIRTRRGSNEEEKKSLRDSITRFTNFQNAVRGLDFFALDNFQRQLQRTFSEMGYYYEIQRGAASIESRAKGLKGVSGYKYLVSSSFDNVLRSKETVQAFAAGIGQRPDIAYGRPAELTPMGEKWGEIVNEVTAALPVEFFLYPFLVLSYAKYHLGYRNGAQDFRKSAALLFTSAYFIATTVLAERVTGKSFDEPTRLPTPVLKSIFGTEHINTRLLALVDRTLESYFEDEYIMEMVGTDLKGFLKNVVKDRPWSALKRRISTAIDKEKDLVMAVRKMVSA